MFKHASFHQIYIWHVFHCKWRILLIKWRKYFGLNCSGRSRKSPTEMALPPALLEERAGGDGKIATAQG